MKVWNKFILIVCLLLSGILSSCNALPREQPSADISTPSSTNILETQKATADQNWVIFSAEQTEKIQDEIAAWLFVSDGYWTPAVDDILKIEENIAEYLIQNANNFHWQPPVWERLDEYQRQYIGLERDGQQIIYGNFFCEDGNNNWNKEFVFAIDGGECYFQVEFDVESGLFIKLRVNGES
jgi:hypothetical protein